MLVSCFLAHFFISVTIAQSSTETQASIQQEWQAEDRPELVEEEDGQHVIWQERLRHPLNINRADSLDWIELGVLSPTQVHNILQYQRVFGLYLDVHELQAVPGISSALLKQLRAWIYVSAIDQQTQPEFVQHQLLLRWSGGTRATAFREEYGGWGVQGLLRYRFRARDWQAGFLAEQDAGELWRKTGADFYSFFVSRQRRGSPVRWVLGDYQFSFGQGLLIGQQVGGNRSVYPEQLIRAPQGLAPYRGAGEFAFFRGGALAWKSRWGEIESMVSYRRLDGSIQEDSSGFTSVGTLYTMGIRRTASERARRGSLGLFTTGLVWHQQYNGLVLGGLLLHHRLDRLLLPADHPRNRYAFRGNQWTGGSLYARGEWRNMLYVGEWVWSSNQRMAMQVAATWSVDRRLDISAVFRHASPGYTAWFGQALSASSRFTNETGLLLTGLVRWSKQWEFGFLVDRWHHPWMRYLVHYPTYGTQWQGQVVFRPKRSVQWMVVYRATQRFVSESGDEPILPLPQPVCQQQWRLGVQVDEWAAWRWRFRMVLNRWQRGELAEPLVGIAWAGELRWQPPRRGWRVHVQWTTSRVPDFNARVYLQQIDLPGLNQLAMLDGNSTNLNLVVHCRVARSVQLGLVARRSVDWAYEIGNQRITGDAAFHSWFWRLQLQLTPGAQKQ